MSKYNTLDIPTLKALCLKGFNEKLLPVKGNIIVGDGPAAFTTKFNLAVDIVAERHMNSGSATPVLRALKQIGRLPSIGSAGGAAWYGQDGVLNSGFADLIVLPSIAYVDTKYTNLDYQPLRDLVISLEEAANMFFEGKHKELLEQFGKRNQAGANALAYQLNLGKIDTKKAALLRHAAYEVMHNADVLLDEFIRTHIFEIVVFEQLTETQAVSWTYDASTKAITVNTESVGPSGKTGAHKTHVLVDTTGTLTETLVNPEIAKTACTGPANADNIRSNLKEHGRLNEDGSIKNGTVITIIGQELHGYDYATVGLTVVGANTATDDEKEPWTADLKFANKDVIVRMMAREGCNLPPPRLSHDKVWKWEQQPLLTTSHAIAASLYKVDDYPAYEQLRDHAISTILEIHPDDLPVDKTSADQLRRYADEIALFENGKLTITELQEKFALCRQFVEIPSSDPAKAEADAEALFPNTFQNATNRYATRYAGITTGYLQDHSSNAETMAKEKRSYTVFASAPLATVKMLCQHQTTGTLQLVTGDAKKLARKGDMYGTDAGDSHVILSPPLITNKPSAFLMSNSNALLHDKHGDLVICKQRKLRLASGEPIPFYVYGNNLNGNPFRDATGKTSTRNRLACDVATLFTNFAGNKAALSASINIDVRILAREQADAGHAWEQTIDEHCKPTQAEFDADVKAALPMVKEQQELEVFLRLLRSSEVKTSYTAACTKIHTASSRNVLMTQWKSGTAAQKQVAADYFTEIASLPAPVPKSLDQWWKENLELPLGRIRTAYEEILRSSRG